MPRLPIDLFQPVLTTAAMRDADARTIDETGVPGRLLMENAGRAAADVIQRELGDASGRRVLVVCGPGNNGGDGLVIARCLHARGATVRVVLAGESGKPSPDSEANRLALQDIADREHGVEIIAGAASGEVDEHWPEWVIDALLGIGVNGQLRSPIREWARAINATPAPTIAIDVPTGLDSDTGIAADDAVVADLTVTMAAPKAGLFLGDGPRIAGETRTVEIGIPRHRLDDAIRRDGAGWMSTDAAVRALLPPRPYGAHKYSAGRVLVVAGSFAYPGAAVMTGLAAARSGSGAVTVAAPQRIRDLLEQKLTEVMTIGLPETAEGTISTAAVEPVLERAQEADSVVVGPGLDRHPETAEFVRMLLHRLHKLVVLDADGLNAVAGHLDVFTAGASQNWVITPHLGEMRRLADGASLDEERPYEIAREWAARLGCALLLKGAPSVVATSSGEVVLSGATTPALATAGTGDVLAGVTAGFMAQGLGPTEAAIAALHLSGRAAQSFASRHAPRTMLATDVIDELPNVVPA